MCKGMCCTARGLVRWVCGSHYVNEVSTSQDVKRDVTFCTQCVLALWLNVMIDT